MKIAAGNLNATARVETRDEVGTLAITFNGMVAQLRDLIGSLEQRVAERTRALATSSEVSRRLSTILDEKQLVAEVVEQVKNAFNSFSPLERGMPLAKDGREGWRASRPTLYRCSHISPI
jgi:nitrate/nitrite-specific signal transduction histidine kinase